VIPYEECVELLGQGSVGRVAVIWDDEPQIAPVNYRWDGSGVVFRTDPGVTLRAVRDRAVAFEIDTIETSSHTGWSVVVRGRGSETDPPGPQAEDSVVPWAPGTRHHWVRIDAETISGRRITRTEDSTRWWLLPARS
jgi:nitroimidazol reductase NimA-like FMN-containing flavoprotein (pyridoxamine 5'-phosphate oxidase superfamily)